MKKKLQLKVINPVPNIDLLCTCLLSHGFQSDIWQPKLGYHLSATYCTFKDNFMGWHLDFPLWQNMGQAAFSEIRKNTNLPQQIYKKHRQYGQSLFAYCDQIIKTDLSRLTDKQISNILKNIFKDIHSVCSWGIIIVVTDFENNFLSGWLEDKINLQVKKQQYMKPVQQVLSLLTTPVESTYAQQEERDLLKLASQSRIRPSRLSAHWRKYCWLDYGYLGPAHDLAYFQKRLAKLKNSRQKPQQVLAKLNQEKQKIKKQQAKLSKKLQLDQETLYLLKTARLFMFLKAYRQEIEFKSIYTIDRLFKELSKRTGMALQQWHYLTPQEILDTVGGKAADIEKINKRIKSFFAYTYIRKKIKFYYGPEVKKLFAGKLYKEKIDRSINQFSGTATFLGKVKGRVKVVNTPWEMAKVKTGDILVSIATNPAIVPAMKKAAAFVTDTGGITCHAAIVAREMKKPCIIGTKIATKVLKDGDRVEVDATKGIVTKI